MPKADAVETGLAHLGGADEKFQKSTRSVKKKVMGSVLFFGAAAPPRQVLLRSGAFICSRIRSSSCCRDDMSLTLSSPS